VQFLYNCDANLQTITLKDDDYHYIVRVRRAKEGEIIYFRNFQDKNIYRYQILNISKNRITLELLDYEYLPKKKKKNLHIGWSIIDPKNIEKTIPYLNEIGVSKISFFYSSLSQKNYRLDIDRINKILIYSSMQSGRSSIIDIEILDNFMLFTEKYRDFVVFDIIDNYNKEIDFSTIDRFIIGCEGGFNDKDRLLFGSNISYPLKIDTILQSHTAVIAISSKIIL
jgi:16S rRNA (uracil1498-N3)-methyltransferase